MQALRLSNNELNKIGNYTKKCNHQLIAKDVELFDQNGYDLSKIEQFYSTSNSFIFKDHRPHRQAIKQDWFIHETPSEGAHINHALLFERKGFAEDAYNELRIWCEKYPLFYKVLNMRPKWGLDISIDYCDRQGNVFEVIHWEYDGFEYDEIQERKERVEKKLIDTDWNDLAAQLLKRKDEWYSLDFFAQSRYKSEFYGIEDERFKLVIWK
jgi:hypothetical protein